MDKSLGAATSAAAAANEFLQLGWAEPHVPSITQMKLQKLLFYGHAWHLAVNECPLFSEDFEAWPWGPVQRDIYFQTKDYGKNPISSLLTSFNYSDSSGFDFRVYEPKIENQDLKKFINSVWESHKRYTGVQLSNSTHAQGEPWTIVKDKFGSLDTKPTIPNELIYNVFRKKLNGGG
ncbi:DUF4065 domain-containing protein [Methylobacterium sp. E-016]|uniref:Panacea domain-containing protein n=1 Tax=Methylobacterium sp. E-016 TaxID=2836556 RepID=UPI001FB8B940|nr:type II toxin-antitoxin system antitoxin SocA domain-containing protein [Methylobacterium sp. E-016]MCJ2077875.1 DUF4065 domain-containing protein [Methylobacterium sp. E-016]